MNKYLQLVMYAWHCFVFNDEMAIKNYECERVMKNYFLFKNTLIFVFKMFVLALLMQITYQYFAFHRLVDRIVVSKKIDKEQCEKVNNVLKESIIVALKNQNSEYDFIRMLHLIEQATIIQNFYYEKYTNPKQVNMIFDSFKIKKTLKNLYRELRRLNRYLWEERIKNKGTLSIKRKRNIQYYQKTIERSCLNLEKILEREYK